jgi:Tfp pilus assembly protein PilV
LPSEAAGSRSIRLTLSGVAGRLRLLKLRRVAGRVPQGLRAHAQLESGFLLIEALMAITIFAIVATGLVNIVLSSTNATTRVKQQTIAEQGVMAQIEQIRAMNYNDIGTVNGCVAGTLHASQPFTKDLQGNSLGVAATMNTDVEYASANVPGTAATGTDYKTVAVSITRNSDGATLAQGTTNVAPGQLPSQTTATIQAAVSDYGAAGTPMQNVAVNLATGPSAPASCLTDASGSVTFPGLTANPTTGAQAYYDLSVVPPAGYQVLSDDAAGQPPVHVQLSPTQVWSTSLSVYKPASIVVDLLNTDGSQYTGAASVTVTSNDARTSGDAKTFTYTGSPLTVTNLGSTYDGGATNTDYPYLVPGQYSLSVSRFGYQTVIDTGTVPTGYPTTLTSTFNETMTPVTANGELDVTVTGKKSTGGTLTCTNASVTLTNPLSVNTGPLSTSAGTANFTGLVPGSPYSVSVTDTKKAGTWTASNITVVAGPTKTTQTVSITPTGTVTTC